jgi:hypothetical protein
MRKKRKKTAEDKTSCQQIIDSLASAITLMSDDSIDFVDAISLATGDVEKALGHLEGIGSCDGEDRDTGEW